jgi:hypothetical protein
MKYRFQWNFPVFFSPHNPNKLYTCSQHLHVSTNGGETWKIISPDLSRNDSEKLVSSGGPITKDNTGVEYYATIFAAIESPYEKDLLWCGSDDGLIHISKDGGANWENVTPKKLPEWALINSIEADPWNKGGLYVAATKYKSGDYTPYLYHTIDYGKSWKLITNGIEAEHFTRVIKADKTVKGLLYCGTEQGMYVSTDDGVNWKSFQLNLPIVPITDIALKDNDMIVATQGRSFWILDDLNIIWDEINASTKKDEMRIYSSHPTVGYGGSEKTSLTQGTNHPLGVRLFVNIPDAKKATSIRILDSEGEEITSYGTDAKNKENKLDFESGMNSFVWDMQYPKADEFDGLLMWWGTLNGPAAPPGQYTAELKIEDKTVKTQFDILLDPRSEGTAEDRQVQFEFLLGIRNKLDETHDAIRNMRDIKSQIKSLNSRIDIDKFAEVIKEGERLDSLMTAIEKMLYQTKLESNQDMLNYPIKLNNKLAHVASLASMGIYRPTDQMIAVKVEITKEIDVELKKWYVIKDDALSKYNELIRTQKVNAIQIGKDE